MSIFFSLSSKAECKAHPSSPSFSSSCGIWYLLLYEWDVIGFPFIYGRFILLSLFVNTFLFPFSFSLTFTSFSSFEYFFTFYSEPFELSFSSFIIEGDSWASSMTFKIFSFISFDILSEAKEVTLFLRINFSSHIVIEVFFGNKGWVSCNFYLKIFSLLLYLMNCPSFVLRNAQEIIVLFVWNLFHKKNFVLFASQDPLVNFWSCHPEYVKLVLLFSNLFLRGEFLGFFQCLIFIHQCFFEGWRVRLTCMRRLIVLWFCANGYFIWSNQNVFWQVDLPFFVVNFNQTSHFEKIAGEIKTLMLMSLTKENFPTVLIVFLNRWPHSFHSKHIYPPFL